MKNLLCPYINRKNNMNIVKELLIIVKFKNKKKEWKIVWFQELLIIKLKIWNFKWINRKINKNSKVIKHNLRIIIVYMNFWGLLAHWMLLNLKQIRIINK